MGAEGSESDDDCYVVIEVTVPAREGRTYRYSTGNISMRRLYSEIFEYELLAWLAATRMDLELGDRTS